MPATTLPPDATPKKRKRPSPVPESMDGRLPPSATAGGARMVVPDQALALPPSSPPPAAPARASAPVMPPAPPAAPLPSVISDDEATRHLNTILDAREAENKRTAAMQDATPPTPPPPPLPTGGSVGRSAAPETTAERNARLDANASYLADRYQLPPAEAAAQARSHEANPLIGDRRREVRDMQHRLNVVRDMQMNPHAYLPPTRSSGVSGVIGPDGTPGGGMYWKMPPPTQTATPPDPGRADRIAAAQAELAAAPKSPYANADEYRRAKAGQRTPAGRTHGEVFAEQRTDAEKRQRDRRAQEDTARQNVQENRRQRSEWERAGRPGTFDQFQQQQFARAQTMQDAERMAKLSTPPIDPLTQAKIEQTRADAARQWALAARHGTYTEPANTWERDQRLEMVRADITAIDREIVAIQGTPDFSGGDRNAQLQSLRQQRQNLVQAQERLITQFGQGGAQPQGFIDVPPVAPAGTVDTSVPPASTTQPPDGAVAALRQNPALADQFDQKYGPGTASRYLSQ